MIIEIYHLIFSSRPSENLLKCFSRFCNLFSQIFHFFHIFNFWWNNHWNISSDFHFFIRLNQICPKLIKMDQTWSNWIYEEIIIEIYRQIFNLIFFLIDSDLSKRDQNGSNLIKLDFWWNNYWNISSDFQLYSFFDQIESARVQNGSNLIKLDFWWNNHWNISSDFQLYYFLSGWIRSVQNWSKWIKLDQTWSNLISDEIIIEIYRQIFHFIYFLIRLNQICPKWIKLDQIIFLMK
jgi:hypothetical protein